MDDAQRRTIIVDYDSLRERLMKWYWNGELRQARAIADSIPIKLDRLVRRLGRQYGESGRRRMAGLKDYSDRRLLLSAGPPAGAGVDAAAEAFERDGFRRFVNPARRRTGSLLMETMRDVLEDRRPREIVIATADPNVVDVVNLLRPAGVMTGLICVFSKERTQQIRGVPDGLVDLRDIADALEIRMQDGFDLTESHPSVTALARILHRAGGARWLSLEATFSELEGELRRAARDAESDDGDDAVVDAGTRTAELPNRDVGRRRYVASILELRTVQRWRLAPDESGLLDEHALKRIADDAERLADGGWRVEGLRELRAATLRSGATPENSWLGHGSFVELLRDVRAYVEGDWAIPEEGLFEELNDEPSTDAGPEEVDGKLPAVARFVGERLNASDTAVTLVDLANAAPEAIGVSAENGWEGRGSFLELIRQANRRHAGDAWILDTDIAPGFIRLRRHPRPVDGTPKPSESRPNSQLRTVVPTFPADDERQLLLRAAVLATVLTRTNVVGVAGERSWNNFSAEARDLSRETTGVTGRQAYAFLLRSLISVDPSIQGEWEPELRLVQVTDELAGREPWKVASSEQAGRYEEPLMGTRAVLRIVSDNFQRYLAAQGYGARYQKEAESRLGPRDADEARARFPEVFDPQRIDEEYRRFRVRYEVPKGRGDELLRAILTEAAMERRLLLEMQQPPSGERVSGSAQDDFRARVAQQISECDTAEDGVTLQELHVALAEEMPDLHPFDVARILTGGEQDDEVDWKMVVGLPYSRVRGRSITLGADSRPVRELAWFRHSMQFWTSLIKHGEPIAVSWLEAARSMIRVESTQKG